MCYLAGMKRITVAAVMMVLFQAAVAEEQVSTGGLLPNRSPATAPSASVDYTVVPELDFGSAAGGLSCARLELDMPLSKPLRINRRQMLVFSAGYEATWLDTDTFLGSMDLHDFRLKVRWLHSEPGRRWAWTALLEPGVGTGSGGGGGDVFSINGQLGFRYRKSPEFAWLGGVMFFHNSMDTRVYPGIGFQWNPSDDVVVRWAGTDFRASWQVHDDWLLHAGVWAGGGTWSVRQGGGGFSVRLRTFHAGLGVERRLTEKIWLGLWGGTTFASNLEIETAPGERLFKEDAETGWFVKLGIRRVFW